MQPTSRGRLRVTVASVQAELTICEAAQLLGISRTHVVKLLEEGAMRCRLVGTHRWVRLVDVLDYRDRQDERSRRAIDELTRQAEDLGLYNRAPCVDPPVAVVDADALHGIERTSSSRCADLLQPLQRVAGGGAAGSS